MDERNNELSNELSAITGLSLMPGNDLLKILSEYINDLITNDFPKLIHLLYRIDISEEKLKLILRNNPGNDAGNLISKLIIERQLAKIESKKKNG